MPRPYGATLHALGLGYGMPTWGFAITWLAIAAAITIRTLRRHLPFSLTWWSFTFPVGTLVTGTAELTTQSHLPALTDFAVALYALLIAAWLTAASRTAHGTLTGQLLHPPTSDQRPARATAS